MNLKRLIPVLVAVVAVIWWIQQSRQDTSVATPAPQEPTQAKALESVPAPEPAVIATEVSPAEPEAADRPSKLANVAGFGHNYQRDERQFSAEEIQREELISDCMRERGYDYTPTASIVVDGDLPSDSAELEKMLRDAADDPNDRYVLALSDIQRTEYFIALTGVADPNNPEAQTYDTAVQSDGCASKAIRAVPGVYAKYNQLRNEFEAMEKSVAEDPAVLQSLKDWSDCMSLEGFQYSHPRDLDRLQDEALATSNTEQLQLLDLGRQAAANCDVEVALNQTYANTRTEHENRFYETYRTQLTAN